MAQQRINWVDSAKGFGILCVIMGHTHVPMDVHLFIYSFHMPLFFLLSGIFLLKKQTTFKDELSRKARTLLWPYLVFNFLLLLFFDFLLPMVKGAGVNWQHVQSTLWGIVTSDRHQSWLWFLPCLFVAEMLLVACSRVTRHRVGIGAVLMALGCLLNHFWGKPLPMSADNVLIAAGFIAAGIGFRDHPLPSKWYTLLLLPVFYAVSFVLSVESTKGKGIEMYDCRYGNYIYFLFAAFSAILFVLLWFRKYADVKPLCWLGRNSLLIYCIHTVILQIPYAVEKRMPVLLFDLELQAFLFSLLSTLFVCLVTIPLAYVVNRYTPWMLGRFVKK